MNFTWDYFWLAVVVAIIIMLIVGILWLPDDPPRITKEDNE